MGSHSFDDRVGTEDGHADILGLIRANGFTASQLDKLKTRTNQELERSKVFLSLLEAQAAPSVAVP